MRNDKVILTLEINEGIRKEAESQRISKKRRVTDRGA